MTRSAEEDRESDSPSVDPELESADGDDETPAEDLEASEPVAELVAGDAAVESREKASSLVALGDADVDHPTLEAPAAWPGSVWSAGQLADVLRRAGLVLAIAALVGFLVGARQGDAYVARTELVYTLDESVPDSFLREDRRLLTQVATMRSDAVLVPVGEQFGLTAKELRTKLDVATVNLSEVIEVEVTDDEEADARALSDAILAQYLALSSDLTSPERESILRDAQRTVLNDRQEVLLAELAEADADLLALQQARLDDPQLATEEESLERQIASAAERAVRLQTQLDDALTQSLSSAQVTAIETELAETDAALVELDRALADVRLRRATLAEQSAQESSLIRTVERLETELATVAADLAATTIDPGASPSFAPVQLMGETRIRVISSTSAGLRTAAIALMVAIPVVGLLAYRIRKRQLWLG